MKIQFPKTFNYLIFVIIMLSLNSIHADEQLSGYNCTYQKNRKLNINYLVYLSNENLAYLRNEIYARYGRIFKTEKYSKFFMAQKWYSPDNGFSDSRLTETDKENIKLIQSLENPSDEDKNLEKKLIKEGEKIIAVTYEKRQYIESENDTESDDEYNGPEFEMVEDVIEIRSVFSSENRCILKGNFSFLPYINADQHVTGLWRIFKGKLYLNIKYEDIGYFPDGAEFHVYTSKNISAYGKEIPVEINYYDY